MASRGHSSAALCFAGSFGTPTRPPRPTHLPAQSVSKCLPCLKQFYKGCCLIGIAQPLPLPVPANMQAAHDRGDHTTPAPHPCPVQLLCRFAVAPPPCLPPPQPPDPPAAPPGTARSPPAPPRRHLQQRGVGEPDRANITTHDRKPPTAGTRVARAPTRGIARAWVQATSTSTTLRLPWTQGPPANGFSRHPPNAKQGSCK